MQGEDSAIQAAERAARTAYAGARTVLQQAQQQEQRRQLERDIAQLDAQLQTLTANLSQAKDYQRQLQTLQDAQQNDSIDLKTLEKLRKTDHALNDARIRSQAVATRLEYTLQAGKELALDDTPLTGSGQHQLLQAATLYIPDVGQVRVIPGGDDLPELRRKLARLTDDHRNQLRALQVSALTEAEARAARQAERNNDIKHLTAMVDAVAPQGLDALAAQEQADSSGVSDCSRQWPISRRSRTPRRRSPARNWHWRGRKQAGRGGEGRQDATSPIWPLLGSGPRTRGMNGSGLRAELESAGLPIPVCQTTRQHRRNRPRARPAGGCRWRSARPASMRAQPDLLQQDMERFQASAEELEKAHQVCAVELATLHTRLETEGAEGLEEQRDELAAEFDQVNRRYEELQRRSQALELLLELLQEKRLALTRRLQAPLQKHLKHYLDILFPDARLAVDDSLVPGQLTRNGQQGPETGDVEALSFGAREQMGLISRLAYADLLREAGRPTLIILDDTLVHSDRQRLDQMKRILFDAAQRHQILLFTCHPERWQDLGASQHDLRALKAAATA